MIHRILLALSCLLLIGSGSTASQVNAAADSLFKSAAGDSLKCITALKIVKESVARKDYETAVTYATKGLEYARQKNYYQGILFMYEGWSEIYFYKTEFDSAVHFVKKAFYLSHKLQVPEKVQRKKAVYASRAAKIYERISYDSSVTWYSMAHDLFLTYRNTETDSGHHANSMAMLAYGYSRLGQTQIAYKVAREAVTLADLTRDDKKISLAYSVLATVLNDLYLHQDAIDAFNRSYAAARQSNDSTKYGQILNGIALVYLKQNDFQKALQYYYKAKDALSMNKASPQYLTVCYNIITLLCEIDSCDQAEIYIKEVQDNMPRYKSDDNYFGSLVALCMFYSKKNDTAKADEYMDRLNALLPLFQSPQTLSSYYLVKSKYLEQKGEYKEGLESFHMHQAYRDSVSAKELAEMAAEKNAIYESARKQEEITRLRSEKDIQRLALIEQQQQITASVSETEKKAAEFELLTQDRQLSELKSKQMQAEIQNAKLRNEKVNAENDLLKKDSMLQQSKLSAQKAIRNAAFIFSALVIIIAFLFYNRWHINQKYMARLEEKNRLIEAEKQKAITSEQYKTFFLANMSHEIRTPLHAITGMINVLHSKGPRNDQKAYLNVMRKSSDNLIGVINNILDISKIEAGKIVFERIIFSPAECVQNIVNMFYVSAGEKKLELNYERGNVPEWVCGDQVRLSQIMINLIGNSIKFTEQGSINVGIRQSERVTGSDGKDRVTVEFQVSDTGIGIQTENLAYVFENFNQEDPGITRKFGGTGLGLSISKQLIDLQGGSISVISQPGKGSTFTFYIPYEVTAAQENPQEPGNEAISMDGYSGLKVMIAEDNSYNRMVAIETLKMLFTDIEIEIAENGARAIELLHENNYDVIFMDLQMPGIDGYTATRIIRTEFDPVKSKTPVIGVSANVTAADRERCMEVGMNYFLTKPFHPSELRSAVQKIVKPIPVHES